MKKAKITEFNTDIKIKKTYEYHPFVKYKKGQYYIDNLWKWDINFNDPVYDNTELHILTETENQCFRHKYKYLRNNSDQDDDTISKSVKSTYMQHLQASYDIKIELELKIRTDELKIIAIEKDKFAKIINEKKLLKIMKKHLNKKLNISYINKRQNSQNNSIKIGIFKIDNEDYLYYNYVNTNISEISSNVTSRFPFIEGNAILKDLEEQIEKYNKELNIQLLAGKDHYSEAIQQQLDALKLEI